MADPSIGTRAYGTPTERAWAAGFFDGEGTIGCYRNHGSHRKVTMGVSQKYGGNLERFRSAVAGLGSITGPKGRKTNLHVFQWRCTRFAHIQAVLAMLWPFLGGPKRQQAQRALLQFRGELPCDWEAV